MLPTNIDLTGKTILVTGAAGFIGASLCKRLLRDVPDVHVIGLDNMNDSYDVHLKESRLQELLPSPGFTWVKGNLADRALMEQLFSRYQPQIVVHLAAQAGVRASMIHPDAYVESNLIGFYHVLEACRHHPVKHFVYASSSSVYGMQGNAPCSTEERTDAPVSLYAATKKSDELMTHAYAKLYGIPSTGLRFFTVYGPAGRPDMAYFSFANRLREGKTIQLFNQGQCTRDFTYVDDVVEGLMRVMQHAPEKRMGEDGLPLPPYKLYNIGSGRPVRLLDFVDLLQQALVRAGVLPEDFDFEAHKELVPMQPGDVNATWADVTALEQDFGFRPNTSLREGLQRFAQWYGEYSCPR